LNCQLHWPNWRKIEDIKPDEMSWTIKKENFLQSDICPNFVKAAIERSKHNTYLSMMLFFVKVVFPFELSRILDPEKLTD
jgi:hypothetical protein